MNMEVSPRLTVSLADYEAQWVRWTKECANPNKLELLYELWVLIASIHAAANPKNHLPRTQRGDNFYTYAKALVEAFQRTHTITSQLSASAPVSMRFLRTSVSPLEQMEKMVAKPEDEIVLLRKQATYSAEMASTLLTHESVSFRTFYALAQEFLSGVFLLNYFHPYYRVGIGSIRYEMLKKSEGIGSRLNVVAERLGAVCRLCRFIDVSDNILRNPLQDALLRSELSQSLIVIEKEKDGIWQDYQSALMDASISELKQHTMLSIDILEKHQRMQGQIQGVCDALELNLRRFSRIEHSEQMKACVRDVAWFMKTHLQAIRGRDTEELTGLEQCAQWVLQVFILKLQHDDVQTVCWKDISTSWYVADFHTYFMTVVFPLITFNTNIHELVWELQLSIRKSIRLRIVRDKKRLLEMCHQLLEHFSKRFDARAEQTGFAKETAERFFLWVKETT